MIKLDWITPADRFALASERWKVDDDIDINLTRYDKHASLTIWHTSGDIADQIYHKAKPLEYFSNLKLGISSNYSIEVPLEKVDKFLKFIEQIDRSTLKEGKKY